MTIIREPIELVASILPKGGCCYFLPNGGNLGDALIAAATIQRLDLSGLDWEFLRGNRSRVTKRDVILFGGGGSLVEAYEGGTDALKSLRSLEAQVVVLPQSINGHSEFWMSARNLIVFCRDFLSYNYMQRYPWVDTFIAHDMATQLDMSCEPFNTALSVRNFISTQPERRTLNAFRKDGEALAPAPASTFDVSGLLFPSMSSSGSIIGHAASLLSVLAMFTTVRTDRLHVAIGAAVLGIDTHLTDNSYGKNRAVFECSLKSLFPCVVFSE
jgi:exopolysaccharide biosynthesis predicted pyruvyltransferase EpsI